MPRRHLDATDGLAYHVVNRSVRRMQLFASDADYEAFLRVLRETLAKVPTRLLGYCIIYNHWHLVVWPTGDELPRFMHRLTMTHAKRWHKARDSTGSGPVYKGPYHAVPVQRENHLFAVLRYVERNALRAGLVRRAEDWRWGSLTERCGNGTPIPLAEWPVPRPDDWLERVNAPSTPEEIERLRNAIRKGSPIGEDAWVTVTAARLGLTLRDRGRPGKEEKTPTARPSPPRLSPIRPAPRRAPPRRLAPRRRPGRSPC